MRVLRDLRTFGILGLAFYWLERTFARAFADRVHLQGLWFYSQPVASEPLVGLGADGAIQVKQIFLGDLPVETFGRPPGAIEERFQDGSVCLAALRGEELAGFMWLKFGALRERLFRCTFEPEPQPSVAWDYDFFVAPKFRLGRTFARLWDEANRKLRDKGVHHTGSWVAFTNRASVRAHERLGARCVGWAVVLTAWQFQLVAASVRPYFHVSFCNDGYCRLRIPLNR